VANLFELLRLSDAPAESVAEFRNAHAAGKIRYGDLKAAVQENLMRVLDPIRERRAGLSDDDVRGILEQGAARARAIAGRTMTEVREMVGVG
jgi:tryptophanyl-tRNA synthetase